MDQESTEPIAVDVPERNRFEIRLGDELAGFADYSRRPGLIAFTHTEIDPSYTGRGLAGRLIARALDGARADGLSVLPFCSFVSGWIEEHPGELELVPAQYREQFGLPADA